MKRITTRTCVCLLVGCLCAAFALSVGLTYRSNHYCYAGVCGEWLFPLQARLHVIVWYLWLSLSIAFLAVRAYHPRTKDLVRRSVGLRVPLITKELRIGGILLVVWVCTLYGILIGIWWNRLADYFRQRGQGLPGNNVVAAVALTGHLADVTMGMVILPVSRHSSLTSFFKLSPSSVYTFHMTQAYTLCTLVLAHGLLYAFWAGMYSMHTSMFKKLLPLLNPTYLYNEVWPGDTSSLGMWRASLIFTGIASTLIMLVMLCTSFPEVRKKHFNLFYFTHLLGIVAIIIICLHASTMLYCTIPGLSLWLLDWGMRIFELRGKLTSRLCALGNGWYTLTLALPQRRIASCGSLSPLAHFYIHHSRSSIREIHPFTSITDLTTQKPNISDSRPTIDVQFLFRKHIHDDVALDDKPPKRTQWTDRLASVVDEELGIIPKRKDSVFDTPSDSESSQNEEICDLSTETSVRLEGPYFTSASPEAYQTVVCLVAGTGLSGALAIAAAFKARKQAQFQQAESPTPGETARPSNTLAKDSCWERCILIWSVRDSDYIDMPFFQDLACEGLEFHIHRTGGSRRRLDVDSALLDTCGTNGSNTWIYISGPHGFISKTGQACQRVPGLTWFEARWD